VKKLKTARCCSRSVFSAAKIFSFFIGAYQDILISVTLALKNLM